MTASAMETDILLIGAGIMSTTLAVMLKELDPALTIHLYETLDSAAQESSNAWNNAGTGHAALCEMNYTPKCTDGHIDITKALEINTEFDLSRQLWSYLTKKGTIKAPRDFIRSVPHYSFVTGKENIAYLQQRFQALTAHPCYSGMLYTEDKSTMHAWAPLVMEGRDPAQAVAMTCMTTGTDVDYGALTQQLLAALEKEVGFYRHFSSAVEDLQRTEHGWQVKIYDKKTEKKYTVHAKFVFIGAGGAALTLLQKSKIAESRGYAGFPVSGLWLRCDNPQLAARHAAKVYGKAAAGSPPMSVPHFDQRHIHGKTALLFGPFAGFSTKFLKQGSYLDFFRSLDTHNILPLITVGAQQMGLVKYLIGQGFATHAERMAALQEYFPMAHTADWALQVAGQRVQIIKKDPMRGGILQFGTELVTAADHSLCALLGASPGASTAVFIMQNVIEKCFSEKLQNPTVLAKMRAMLPSYGSSLIENTALCQRVRDETAATLELTKQLW